MILPVNHIFQVISDNEVKIASFDIFDTLLFRICSEPTLIFEKIGKSAVFQNKNSEKITPSEFQLLRIKAEKEARKHKFNKEGHEEVTLEEIYSFLPSSISSKKELIREEIRTESEYCYLNYEINDAIIKLHKAGIKIVLTSDMYLSSKQIIDLLEKNNFNTKKIENIFVSSEHKCSKFNKNLFKIVLSKYKNLNPSQFIHIGDKIDADVESPKSLGMFAIHYNTIPSSLKDICEYEKIYGLNDAEYNSIRKLSVQSTNKPEKIYNQIGAGILGPVFTFFCEWVLDLCIKEGKQFVYPFMREAELFLPMLENAAKKRKSNVKIIPLYVSRKSTWIASLKQWDQPSCDDLMGKIGLTVNDISHSLELPFPKSIYEKLGKCKIKSLSKNDYKRIVDYLFCDNSIRKINQKIKEKRRLLTSYLLGLEGDFLNSVTIDLGFRGTTNANIEKNLYLSNVKHNLLHLLTFGCDSIINHKFQNIDIRGFLSNPKFNQDYRAIIHRSLYPLEQLFVGCTGTTSNYKVEGGKTVPVTEKVRTPKRELNVKKNIRKSSIIFQNLFYRLSPMQRSTIRNNLKFNSEKRKLAGIFSRMIDLPTPKEAEFLGSLHHDHNDGSSQVIRICSPDDKQILKNSHSVEHFLKIARIHEINWPQGVLTSENPHFLLKKKLELDAIDSYLKPMNNLILRLKEKNIFKIIIFGAGEAGQALQTAAKINHVKVLCFVDSKDCLWGEKINNINVFSLTNALQKFGTVPIVIGSFHFLKQIEDSINRTFEKLSVKGEYYSAKDTSDSFIKR